MAITYDTANTILNTARQRLKDEVPTLLPVKGSILDRTQGWTQQAFNTSWRKLQTLLLSNPDVGFQGLKLYDILANVPATGNTDPASNVALDINSSPALPTNLIEPLQISERIYSGGSPGNFLSMDKLDHEFPAVPKANWNRFWQWTNDTLFIPGSLVAMDIRIFYNSFLADIADSGNTPWFQQPVPISRCLDSLASYICAEYAAANMDMDGATMFEQKARDAAMLINQRDVEESRLARSEADLRARMVTASPDKG